MRWRDGPSFVDLLFESDFLRYYFIGVILLFIFAVPILLSAEPSDLDRADLDPNSMERLTFLSCPTHLISDSVLDVYKIAVSSWLLTHPSTQVILFVDTAFEKETDFASFFQNSFGNHRIVYVSHVKRDCDGIPLLNDLLLKGIQLSRARLCCFIQMNIVVDDFWYKRVMRSLRRYPTGLAYVTGQSLYFYLNDSRLSDLQLDHNSFFEDLKTRILRVDCREQVGSDYFVWRIDPPSLPMYDIPDFRIGGSFWDQYMNAMANSRTQAATMGMSVPVYHIENPQPSLMNVKSGTYHNAKLISDRDLARIDHSGFLYSYGPFVTDADPSERPFIRVPACHGKDNTPFVHL